VFFVPNGQESLAQGLPWDKTSNVRSPEGAPAFGAVVPVASAAGAPSGPHAINPITQGKPWAEWREVKASLGRFIAPKGLYDSAQGFNPGNRISPAKSPEGAPDLTRNATHQTHRDLSPLQGKSRYSMVPRVETLG
jgi:hypothetical protein